MLFDSFEKQFDLPAAAIELSNRQRRLGEIVGQKNQRLAGLRIAKPNASQSLGILLLRVESAEHHGLVEAQTRRFVHRTGVTSLEPEVLLGASYEEGPAQMQAVESGEVQVTAIGDVEGAGGESQIVENVDLVNFASSQDNDSGEIAPQSQQRMQLDSRFAPSELGPRKQGQTQVDRGRVQGVGGLLQFGPKGFVGVELSGLLDEDVSEIGEDSPIALFVGVGQSAADRGLADAAVVEFGAQSPEAGLDVAQALAVSQLGEGQHQEMLVAGQCAHMLVASVTANTFVEFVFGQFVYQLGEHGSALIHNRFLLRKRGPEPWAMTV